MRQNKLLNFENVFQNKPCQGGTFQASRKKTRLKEICLNTNCVPHKATYSRDKLNLLEMTDCRLAYEGINN